MDNRRAHVISGLATARFLWPEFVRVHNCIFLAVHAGSSPPPANDSATGWESFVNHTHVLDEFDNGAVRTAVDEELEGLTVVEEFYDELHPDFIAACQMGKLAAKLWAVKLQLDFPGEQFRVYYTEFDNPVLRFHMVRLDEPVWLTNEIVAAASHKSFKNVVIYDTSDLSDPFIGPKLVKN